MKEYIELAAAEKAFRKAFKNPLDMGNAQVFIDILRHDVPAADVRPAVRGEWIISKTFDDCVYARCDQCATTQIFYYGKPLTNFCPSCGADMRKKENNNG